MASLALPTAARPLARAQSLMAYAFRAFAPVASSSAASGSSSRLAAFSPAAFLPAIPLGLGNALAGLLELLPPIVLAVPKSKISHSRKSMRSANKGLKNKTNLTHCAACGTLKLAHNLCPTCFSQISRRWKKEARGEGATPKE